MLLATSYDGKDWYFWSKLSVVGGKL